MKILYTERLVVRPLAETDAEFIFELVNEPGWLKNIGDKNVRTLDDARRYIANGPVASYSANGFGLCAVELKETGEAIGICGLIKRDSLSHPDIGFAFLERFWSRGFGVESARAVMDFAQNDLGLDRVLAITNPDNKGSIKVLGKIGLSFEKMIRMPGEEKEIKLFAWAAPSETRTK
jgi:RimJ/RimL family protein N-acetyltransferase